MQKEICNQISVLILEELGTQQLAEVNLSTYSKLYSFDCNDFELEESIEEGDYGIRYQIDSEIIIETPAYKLLNLFRYTRRCCVYVKALNGKIIRIGSAEYPARVLLKPELNTSILKLLHKSPSSVFRA